MITLNTRPFAGIECLLAEPTGYEGLPLPTVIFYHGFTSSKTVYSYFAVALAQAGFRVVMPDAAQHGSRYNGDSAGRWRQFWQILTQNLQEFSWLRDALLESGLVKPGSLGIGGASMGGMTALGIMGRHPEVQCVACLMGSGYYTTLAHQLFPPEWQDDEVAIEAFKKIIQPLAEYDVSNKLENLADRPLMLWHGTEDDVVPATETFKLVQALHDHGLDSNLTSLWGEGVKHRITPEALQATVDFFKAHLG